jgi:hypothetical protein
VVNDLTVQDGKLRPFDFVRKVQVNRRATTQRATKGFSVAKPPQVSYVIHRNPPMSLPYCLT